MGKLRPNEGDTLEEVSFTVNCGDERWTITGMFDRAEMKKNQWDDASECNVRLRGATMERVKPKPESHGPQQVCPTTEQLLAKMREPMTLPTGIPYVRPLCSYDLAAGPDKPQKSLEESYPRPFRSFEDEAKELTGQLRHGVGGLAGESHCTRCGYHVCSCKQIEAAKADLQKPLMKTERPGIEDLEGADILKVLWTK